MSAVADGLRSRLPSLTGLRWWAALLVFGDHFRALLLGSAVGAGPDELGPADRVVGALFDSGFVGVSCFFLLSGFILTWSRRPDDTTRAFWQRRFAKIYPIFAVTTLLAIVLLVGAGQAPAPRLVALQAVLLQAWVPDQAYSFGLNPVTWSLSCEAFFYLCFPALFLLLSRARARTAWTVIVCCLAMSVLLPLLASATFELRTPGTETVPTGAYGGPFLYWVTYVFPVTRIAEFTAGIAAARLVRIGSWRGPRVPAALALCIVAMAVNTVLPGYLRREAGMFVPFLLLIAALAIADVRGTWSPMRGRLMVYLGEVSFALYAVQLLIIVATAPAIRPVLVAAGVLHDATAQPPWWVDPVVFVAYLVVCTGAAAVLHQRVERPMVRFLGPRRHKTSKELTAGGQ